MTFQALSTYLEKLEKTTSRNEITRILAELFKKTSPLEIDKICYLLLGKLVPAYRGIEFNLAEKMMTKILSVTYSVDQQFVTKQYKKSGDLGDTTENLANSKFEARNSKLSISEVYERLMEVAREGGGGSQERKIRMMAKLLGELDPLSAKFVARIPVGKLRLGFSDVTILDALSVMERDDKSARPEIERAFNVTADIGKIAQAVKTGGIKSLSRIKAQPGIPIRPSLAERLASAEEIIEKSGPKVGIEPKLDGFRTTIHIWYEDNERQVATFSRNLENTTPMFPEIIQAAEKLPVKEIILDGEAIAYNPKTGKFLPFQETVQRKRKHGIEEAAKRLPLKIFVFDILYLDGRSLLELPFRQRREILEKTLKGYEDGIKINKQLVTDEAEVIRQELKRNVKAGLEGLVAKKLDAPYQAGGRGFHWVKLKATTAVLGELRGGTQVSRQGLLDTIDCVVMGAYRGRGKRAGFGVGGFLLGVRGEDDKFYTISKLGTGLSDEQFREANRRVEKLKVKEKPKEYMVVKEEKPDVWLRPSLVVEILADEITLSPRHTARSTLRRAQGSGQAGRGYSLRFPRLVRFRDDKNPEDATTVKEIEGMYKQQ